jgi:alpha-L-fucosidase
MSRLEALGSWLRQNGEAIYGTHPWERATGETSGGMQVRFTAKGSSVYVTLLGKPTGATLTLRSFTPKTSSKLFLLGLAKQLPWSQHGDDTVIDLPSTLPGQYAYVVKVVQP